jgi:hypothetical protein
MRNKAVLNEDNLRKYEEEKYLFALNVSHCRALVPRKNKMFILETIPDESSKNSTR